LPSDVVDVVVETCPEEQAAHIAASAYEEKDWVVAERQETVELEYPPLPYSTAELLADAHRLLGWGAGKAMGIAQSLYDEGFITYPRTDSQRVADSASEAAKEVIRSTYGTAMLGRKSPNERLALAPHQQDAHEAIRPSDPAQYPDALRSGNPQGNALYRLIWQRFIASHMRPAQVKVVTVTLEAAT
jgi:DNA topoisomerase-1